MYCPQCGTENAEGTAHCIQCGAALEGGQVFQPPGGAPQPLVKNHLVWSILVTLFCCLPFGIVAIVKSAGVNTLVAAGDYQGAIEKANSAKKWIWISFAVGLVVIIISIILQVLAVLSQKM
ncbi:MAG: CD225/dispanin family protein [Proteobacteria bacterium]|nr:CD225/dispanin family protein [Pseudomonadota bacterium]